MASKNFPLGDFRFTGKNNGANILAKCTICRNVFERSEFTVLEDQARKTTLHVTCRKCNTAALIFLSAAQDGAVGLGIVTDLNREEAIKMFGREAVSADEIIDMHQLVSKHKGSFTDLFKKIN